MTTNIARKPARPNAFTIAKARQGCRAAEGAGAKRAAVRVRPVSRDHKGGGLRVGGRGVHAIKIATVVVAAACAGLIAAVAPGVAIGGSRANEPQVAGVGSIGEPASRATPARVDGGAERKCVQTWPYYEHACLHDSRQPDGKAHVVRIIAIDRLSESVVSQMQN